MKFATLTHELGHLALGHLGSDAKRKVSLRGGMSYAYWELEAESVSYLVCGRHGVVSKSQPYLSHFLTQDITTGTLDIYQIMRAAGMVELWLGIGAHGHFDTPARKARRQ